MNSDQVKNISFSPFVLGLTFAVLKSIKTKKLVEGERYVIDADLVPMVSEEVMQASMMHQVTTPREEFKLKEIPSKENWAELTKPIFPSRKTQIFRKAMPAPERKIVRPEIKSVATEKKPNLIPTAPQRVESVNPKPMEKNISPLLANGYDKIKLLLDDPSVTLIECPGPGKTISVLRAGQKELTRIVLQPTEVLDVLKKISEEAHIPLIEGVFRASVENLNVNAVVSEMIGSRFLIKKQTPYSLLEKS